MVITAEGWRETPIINSLRSSSALLRKTNSDMGEGVVLRIKMEQNEEVCFEAKVGEKAKVLLVPPRLQ